MLTEERNKELTQAAQDPSGRGLAILIAELYAKIDVLEASNKELKLQNSSDLIGQEHRLGSEIEVLKKKIQELKVVLYESLEKELTNRK